MANLLCKPVKLADFVLELTVLLLPEVVRKWQEMVILSLENTESLVQNQFYAIKTYIRNKMPEYLHP